MLIPHEDYRNRKSDPDSQNPLDRDGSTWLDVEKRVACLNCFDIKRRFVRWNQSISSHSLNRFIN